MAITIDELRQARRWATKEYQLWKQQIMVNDHIAAHLWEVITDDGVREDSEPLVENIYTGSLEDKFATAGQAEPQIITWPKRGTRKDMGEKQAAAQRRVHLTYRDRSTTTPQRLRMKMYRDWFHAGAVYLMPWADFVKNGMWLPDNQRFPWYQRFDPRASYPIARNAQDRITAFMSITQRPVADIRHELGKEHPAIRELEHQKKNGGMYEDSDWLEEIWYFDEHYAARGLCDPGVDFRHQGQVLVPRTYTDPATSMEALVWISPPSEHGLGRCPVVGGERITHDDRQPRGILEGIIPQLKIANNFMRRLLDDLAMNIHAPVIIEGVENPEEYAVGAVLVGDGTGNAGFVRDRDSVNFEAQQTVRQIMAQAASLAKQPQQRGGEIGASIASDKAVNSVQAAFNEQLGWAMGDISGVLSQAHAVTAKFDMVHCAGTKTVLGRDGMTAFEEEYDPSDLFDEMPLVDVTYGPDQGLERQEKLTALALASSQGWVGRRTAAQRSGLVDDVLQEEREQLIDAIIGKDGFFVTQMLPQQLMGGNLQAAIDFVNRIDDDSVTAREAVFDTIRESLQPVAPPSGPGGTPGPNPIEDIIRQTRSLQAGGIPGNAEGQPIPGRELRNALPSPQARLASEAG